MLCTLGPVRFDGSASPLHRELVEAILFFTFWGEHALVAEQISDLNSSFEMCSENQLLEFIRRMNKKLIVFKSQSYLVYFFPILLPKWGILSMFNLWKLG